MASASASLESATRGAKSSAALEFLKSSPKKLLINGKWVPSKSGKTFETLNPSNEQVLALVAEGDKADVDEAVKHARKAYEEGKWAKHEPASAHALPAEDCGADRQARRGAGRARDARQRQAAVRVQEYRHPWRRRDLPLLRRLRDQDLRRDQPVRSLDVQLHAARAGRRMRTDHPVEFPAADGVVEDCARARMRQRRHPEARRADSADRDSPRRAYLRSRDCPRASCRSSRASAPAPAARSPSIPISTRSRSPARPKSAS